MSRLPLLSARKLISTLSRIGFSPIRQKGSHVFLRHEDGRTTIVPVHPGEKIDRGLLLKIIKKDVQIEVEDFLRLLK
jgi:predicted RNA binding protein YcfA (HicA-like mRNA interferase family)